MSRSRAARLSGVSSACCSAQRSSRAAEARSRAETAGASRSKGLIAGILVTGDRPCCAASASRSLSSCCRSTPGSSPTSRGGFKMKKGMYMRLKTKGLIAIFILVIVLSACSSKNEVVISGKPWTEQYILPYILGGVIEENTDYDVKYEEGLGEVAILTPALDKGEIDLYVEYTGTGLKDVLEEETEP